MIDSLQLTANFKVATPANWTHGDNVMITPAVPNEEAVRLLSPRLESHSLHYSSELQLRARMVLCWSMAAGIEISEGLRGDGSAERQGLPANHPAAKHRLNGVVWPVVARC